MKCRLCIVANVFLLFSVCHEVSAQPPPTGLACAVDVPIPVYRGIFWKARVMGEAKAMISIGATGAPTLVDVQSTQPALVAWLKPALLRSVFLDRCTGQTVEIKFVYRLTGSEEPDPRNEVRLKGPNVFEITAQPPIADPQP
jgi:hypothetical protein